MKQLQAIFITAILSCILSFQGTAQSTETDFLTFSFSEQTGDATINTTDHTIQIEVATETDAMSLTPTFTLSEGATTSPESGVSNDFSNDVTYAVIAEDGITTQDWTISVAIAANTEADFLTFSMLEQTGSTEINTSDHVITLEVDAGTDLSNLQPFFTLSQDATTSLTNGVAADFSSDVIATVTAADGITTQDWIIRVYVKLSSGLGFRNFIVDGQIGYPYIDNVNKVVNVTVRTGTDLDITPEFFLAVGNTSQPESMVTQDFSSPISYQLTSEDGLETASWLVTISEEPKLDFLSFSLNGQVYASTIDTSNHTIDVPMPFGTELSEIGTFYQIPSGVTANVLEGEDRDYSSPVTLTLTLDLDGSSQDWVVTAWPEPVDYSKLIAYYPFDRSGNDISGNGYSSYSITNVDGTDRFGKNYVLGGGAEFEYDEALDILFQDSYSIAFWIKVNNASDGHILSAPGLTLDYESTAGIILSTITKSDGTTITGPMISVTTGVWEHCIFTSNGIEFVTYRNGVQENATAPDTEYLFNSGSFIVGDSDANYEIDDMLILNEPLNGTEASDLYQYQIDAYNQLTKPLFRSIDHPTEQQLPNLNINDRTVKLVMSSSEDLSNLEVSVRLIDNAIVKLGDVEKEGGSFVDDFSSDVSLSFISEDGYTQQDWTVSTRKVGSATDFLTFTLPEQTSNAEINTADHIIQIEVARGTDLSNLTPTFTLSEGATSDIASGIARDFSDTVTYTIQAEDRSLSTQAWKVAVSFTANTETDFLTFSIEGSEQIANVSTTDHTIELDVEAGSDLTYLIPSFSLSEGASAEPASGVAQNFSSDVVYTITAEDGLTTQEWVASISNIPAAYTFTSVDPATGSLIDVSGTSFVLTFTDPIPESLLIKDNFGINSRMSGEIDFTLSGGDTESIILTPSNDLLAGDDITVTVRNNLITGGKSLRYKTSALAPQVSRSFNSVQEKSFTFFRVDFFDIVDLDSDGALDFLSMRSSHGGNLIWAKNSGSENLDFSEIVINVNENYSGDVSTLDLNRDGNPEPVLGSDLDAGAAIYQYDSVSEVWQEQLITGNEDSILKLLTADLNNDLKPDIVALSRLEEKLILFQNRGELTPSFTAATKVLDEEVSDFLLEDLNGDGYIDILTQTSSGSIRAYYNDGNANPAFSSFEVIARSDERAFTVAYLTNSNTPQLILSKDNAIIIYNLSYDPISSEPILSQLYSLPESTSSYDLVLADIDADDDLDIISLENEVFWYENISNNDTEFTRKMIGQGESTSYTLHVADMNGDAALDILTAAGEKIRYYEAVSNPGKTDFLSFSLDGQVFSSTIDTVNHTIDVPMPHESLGSNPQSTFELSEGASAGFISGDFIPFQAQRGRTLTVTSSDGTSTQDWTATVWPIPVEPTNMNAYYSFDGNGLDISGSGHNGTTTGDLGNTLDRFGKPHSLPQEAKFSFSSAFNLFNQSSYTVAFWIKVVDSPDGVVMSSPAISLEYESVAGEIHSKFSTETGTLNGPQIPVSNNQWEHCVFTITGEQIRSYRNGVFESSTTGSTSFLFESGDFNIGDQSAFFEIDDVLILSYPANSTEIEAIYNEQADEFYQSLRPFFYGIDHPDQAELEIFDFSNRTVDIEMPSGTDLSDLSFQTRLIDEPTIKMGGVEQSGSFISGDFSEDVTLTFVSADGLTTQDWIIRVSNGIANTATDFQTFEIEGQTSSAFIDQGDHVINVPVSESVDLTNLVATFTLSSGATSSPASGVAQDFSNPFTYEVTAEDGVTTQNWMINVSQQSSGGNDFVTFEFEEQTGPAQIDFVNHQVTVEVGFGSDITRLTPTFTLSEGATSNPISGVERDFSATVEYVITAADETQQIWEVVVSVAESISDETDIISFKIPNQIGEEVIDLVNHTVDVILPIGSDRSDLTPTIEVSFGATIDPESGEARDFNFVNSYTVTAQDLVSTESWAVSVGFEANSMPTDIVLDNSKLFAVTGANQLVGKIQVLDPNETDVHTLSIVPGSQFSLDGNSLFTTNELEAGNYGVTIAAQDLAGSQISRNFTIEVIAIETDNSISIGTSIDDYRIIGLPTDRARVSSVFTNLTTEEQGSSWRILDYQSDGSYNDLSLNSEMLAGKGYWILADKEITVALDQDPVTLDDDGNFMLSLRPGWNLISNPFFEEINWNQNIQRNVEQGNITTSDIQTGVIVYNGAYSSSTALDLLQGGWVNVFSSSNISIHLQNPAASQGSSGRVATSTIHELRFTLSDERRSSTLAGFSFKQEASILLDAFDQVYPPEITSDHRLRLIGSKGIDFISVPPTASFHETWQVVAPSSQELYLSWEPGQLIPFEQQFYLIRNDEQVVDMNQVSRLRVNHGDQIEVVTGLADHRLIVQTFPNPADNLLRVKVSSFATGINEEIQLKIFDMTGKVMQENQFRYQQEVQLSTASLPDGLYIVRTWIGDELMNEEKIMIQHK